ncbi:MAG: UDP-N-acetylglucosamine 2-epimerase (non-hydrolyzing) [Planctomycetes bacterium]|nr:UDP-N-acetylglucosamine 2-epimerase (non-hydrolyzing) [Planctomycetota bacterium]
MPVDLSIVIGTRPEAIKCAPVLLALRDRGLGVRIVASGQHAELADDALRTFGLSADVNLHCMGDDGLTGLASRLMGAIGIELAAHKPRLVIVQGDTTTAMIGALAACYARLPCAHIEAGLRSGNLHAPWPEEVNRLVTDRLANRHYAPTAGARDNLLREGIPADSIVVTGQTGVDACLWMARAMGDAPPGRLADVLPAGRLVYATAHRRENKGGRIARLLRGVVGALDASGATCLLAAHPDPDVQEEVRQVSHERLIVTAPLSYAESVWLIAHADVIVTDSGGIQEEAPSFGTPVLVARDVTERPEGLEASFLRLVGTDPEQVRAALHETLIDTGLRERLLRHPNPYGDGQASERIARDIAEYLTLEP